MPLVSTLLLVLAASFGATAWWRGWMDPDGVTYRDVAGALTLIGLCAAATIEPEQMMRIVQRQRRRIGARQTGLPQVWKVSMRQ